MKRLAQFAVAALAAGAPASAYAQVEYTIETDPAFPSVVYVEFNPDTLPKVYTAPGSGAGLPVIRGGEVDGSLSAPAPATDSGQTSSMKNSGGGAVKSVDQRAQDRVKELLESSPQEIENKIIDRKIEDEALKGLDLNG
ncbi:MAG: hypothetical protein Kow0026_20350 [Oricola sp.]